MLRALLTTGARSCSKFGYSAPAYREAYQNSAYSSVCRYYNVTQVQSFTASKGIQSVEILNIYKQFYKAFDYYQQLSKAKLSALVALTSATGYMLASPENIDYGQLFWTTSGTFLAACSASCCNQLIEKRYDSQMARTKLRPLACGKLTVPHAVACALITGSLGIGILYYTTNQTTAQLGAANIFLYACVYTPLKRVTIYNTWVGAVVGAIPPLMGWTAANPSLDIRALILPLALYFWQIPHFLALAWMYRTDYARAGFNMLPRHDLSGARMGAISIRNSLYLVPLGCLAAYINLTSPWFALETLALSGVLAYKSVMASRHVTTTSARSLFRFSLVYLPLFMLGAVVHRLPQTATTPHQASQLMTMLHPEERVLIPDYRAVLSDMQLSYVWLVRTLDSLTAEAAGWVHAPLKLLVHQQRGPQLCPQQAGCQSEGSEGERPGSVSQAGANCDKEGTACELERKGQCGEEQSDSVGQRQERSTGGKQAQQV